MDLKNKRTAIIAAVIVGVLLVAFAAYAFTNDSMSARLGLTDGAAQPKTGDTGTSGGAAGSGGKAGTPGNSTGSTDTASGGNGATGGGSASGGTGSGTDSGSSGAVTGKGIKVRILWWNDTIEKQPSSPEVSCGGSVFKPGPGASDSGVIGPLPVDKRLQLVVYPDGKSGTKIVTDFILNEKMQEDSSRDGIHIEVRDDGVRVLGNPVIDFTHSYKR